MLPVRLAIILLATILLALGAAPSALAQRQRRVFTNEDVAAAAPAPQAATTPAETAEAPAEKAAGGESAAPATPAAAEQPAGAPPPGGMALAQFLQGILRRFHTEFAEKLEQEADPSRQARWRTMMELTMQLMTQNQVYISELGSEAKAAAPTESPSTPESPPAPATPQ
ncbi:MAG: hypothetical protein A3H28_13925 [Acidobacteria bacterium RIFCSPLOWO2_02_FULL_61_28]|nr:MAG: hypothetical protein A3H28_13925 [Acidobacteria bacterium RIFCSPLOWO2_02_FULL_61_28]